LTDVFLFPSHDFRNHAFRKTRGVEPRGCSSAPIVKMQTAVGTTSVDLRIVE
jgi:hypothetical protein